MGTHDLRTRLARIAAQEGRLEEAAHLYAQVLDGNPYCVEAWWGLSEVVDTREQALYCVQRVLHLDPRHPAARERLAALGADYVPA